MNADEQGTTFRWSLRKIRLLSLGSGAAVGIGLAVFVLYDALLGDAPSVNGRFYDAMIGLAIAAAAGCVCGVLIAAVLMIGRAGSKTVITADGLYVQRTLWHRTFVRWSDIQSAQRRDSNGWRYIYMKTSSTLPDVGLSIEVDNPRDFETEIARYALPGNPLRAELESVRGSQQGK
jgi:hypothetical protein